MYRKLIVKIKGNANAESWMQQVLKYEKSNGVVGGSKYQCNGSMYKVMIYGDFNEGTYARILGGKKDLNK